MSLDRRRFLTLAAGGMAGACASLVVTPVQPVGRRIRLRLADWPLLQSGGGYARIRVEGTETVLYVLALTDGTYATVSPICKHQGCTVDIDIDRLSCRCHGSQYSRAGAVLRGPTRAPLDRYRTEVTAVGVLVIDLEVMRS